MGSRPHADSMEMATTIGSILFTNCRGFTTNLQITQVITIGIIQGKPALLTGFLLQLAMHRTWPAYLTGCLLRLRRPIRDNPSGYLRFVALATKSGEICGLAYSESPDAAATW